MLNNQLIRRILLLAAITFSVCAFSQEVSVNGEANAQSDEPQAPLTQQVQDLKQQVLQLNRDLFILEEELLFPANTQLAVFLSMDVGEFFKLDAVKLTIDDSVVTNYLYTERQLNALLRGGVQRLHLGNLKSGEHELVAVFTGKGPHGRDYTRGATLVFDKSEEAKNIELKIMDATSTQQPEFVVKEW
jgi:hypothetical protein